MVVKFDSKKIGDKGGNKAKFLMIMKQNGFNVPDGFVIDSDTYLEEIKYNKIDKKIEEFSSQLNSPILSISGISHLSGTSIIAELNNLKKFTNASQVIRYAGVNPIVYQSGNFNATMTRLSKKGSKYLRKTLFQIITPVINNNPVFKNYYNKKIAEGKSHRCAQGHCVRKLLRVIFHLIKTGESFNPELIR